MYLQIIFHFLTLHAGPTGHTGHRWHPGDQNLLSSRVPSRTAWPTGPENKFTYNINCSFCCSL